MSGDETMPERSPEPRRGTLAQDEFSRGADEPDPGFFADLWDFIRENKKWWITPIVVTLVAIGAILVLTTTAAGPFIYALF